jgi:glycerol-3-phosphate acyltransferase PlsY
MDSVEGVGVLAFGYCVGCLSPGYYLVRLRTGGDLRAHGSGVTGARNASRVLGRSGFALTFGLDFAKGALVLATARLLTVDPWVEVAAMLAVVCGHIWPAQLGFRGGRGLATSGGALLVHDFAVLLAVICLLLLFVVLTRSLMAAALMNFLVWPPILFTAHLTLGLAVQTFLGLSLLCVILLATHRSYIPAEFRRLAKPFLGADG